jgi:hypothetical protein
VSKQTRSQTAVVRRVERAVDELTRRAIADLDDLPWWQVLDADTRSSVGLVVQAGITQLVTWLRGDEIGEVALFGAAPRQLARRISLAQTVELVRRIVDVVENAVDELGGEDEQEWLRDKVLRYSREIAFAAAAVYAQAAEQRGAWDARLQTLLVDAIVAGDATRTVEARAAALGWSVKGPLRAVVAAVSPDKVDEVVVRVQRAMIGRPAVSGAHGAAVLVLLPARLTQEVIALLTPGFVVTGPAVTDLSQATVSTREALAALVALPAWPGAPNPVSSDELLPERALSGDAAAASRLIELVHAPLRAAGRDLVETVACFLEEEGSIEATARHLYVHANTVRYRLQRTADLTGLRPAHPREGFVLRCAILLSRLHPVMNEGDL